MKFYSLLVWGYMGLMATTTDQGGQYTDQVKAQLALIRMVASNEGWKETHGNMFGSLDKGESRNYSITLRSVRQYKVVADCDNDCSDLDIAIYYNGNLVAKDNQCQPPVVDFTPSRTGEFKLKVIMYQCRSNPCDYWVSVLGKDAD